MTSRGGAREARQARWAYARPGLSARDTPEGSSEFLRLLTTGRRGPVRSTGAAQTAPMESIGDPLAVQLLGGPT